MALVTHAGRKVALPAGLGELEHDDYDDVLEDIEHEDLTRGAQTTAEAEGDDDLEDDDALKLIDSKDTIHEVCNLLGDAKMAKVLDDMKRSVEDRATMMKESIPREDPEYQLIHDALSGCVRLQVEMSKAHRFTRIKYAKVYKELHEFVVEPVTYAKAVRLVGFNRQLEPLVDKLGDAGYAGAVIAKILVTLSTTAQESTTPEEQKNILDACDHIQQLEKAKAFLLDYTQMRMPLFAPNVSELIGPAIASQVIGIVGGLENLVRLPAESMEILGQTKKSRKDAAGLGASQFHGSFLLNCDIVRAQPPDFRSRAMRMVSNRLARCARVDNHRDNPDGSLGRRLREEIIKNIAGIMDGTLSSSYHRQRPTRKRGRDAQDAAVLHAAGISQHNAARLLQHREAQQQQQQPQPAYTANPPQYKGPSVQPSYPYQAGGADYF